MKKFTLKPVISLILTAVVCFTSAFTTHANAKEAVFLPFENIDDIRTEVTKIYKENYDELVRIARTVDDIDFPDEYITYDSNCGPCSLAFQDILYRNNILTEIAERSLDRFHAFNLYRSSLSQDPDRVRMIIIDTTYKQFIVEEYTKNGLTMEDMSKDVPPVLVYEYGDTHELSQQLIGIKNSLPDESYKAATKRVLDSHQKYDYIPQDFQDIPNKQQWSFNNRLLEDLRNNSGITDKTLENSAIIQSTTNEYSAQFKFDGNGIYRCLIENADIEKISNGFVIKDENDKIIFGSDCENTVMTFANIHALNRDCDVVMLDNNHKNPISINTQGLYLPLLISIDIRAGEGKAAMYAHPISRVLQYGDVDCNGFVSIEDVTYLQKIIAKHNGYNFDLFSKETSNILKIEPDSIFNATEISRYIAQYNTEKCDQMLYFSNSYKLSTTQDLGYIDMSC